jgi:hypothetical protein
MSRIGDLNVQDGCLLFYCYEKEIHLKLLEAVGTEYNPIIIQEGF